MKYLIWMENLDEGFNLDEKLDESWMKFTLFEVV